ncbi:MAG: hypothetical protein M3T49_03530 [Candidatus Eremiobacteraeota bacterium]|nr:hypothetical protein [Candidatus Eremiobacteraeota bacterium]
MLERLIGFLIAAWALAVCARADQQPTYSGPLSAPEKAFVRSIQTDLNARFPHARDAERAGFVRYTGVDETGAVSYANMHWTSADIRHPSQLWYDTSGNLLGADFSVPKAGNARPNLFGVNPGRWYEFDDHVHYVVREPATGKMKYDGYIMAPKFAKAGGDPKHPSAAMLMKLGRVKKASDVTCIFDFPSVWDLIVWVKPNPNGAFAEKNPLVKR